MQKCRIYMKLHLLTRLGLILLTAGMAYQALADNTQKKGWPHDINSSKATEVLGVSRLLSDKGLTGIKFQLEVKRAYRILILAYHPDIAGEQYLESSKKVSMAYEALRTLDGRAFFQTFKGVLGLTPEEIRRFGGTATEWGGESSSGTSGSAEWFGESVFKQWAREGGGPFGPMNFSDRRDLQTGVGLFSHGISAIYQNQFGVVIQSPIGEFFWLPRNSRIFVQLHTSIFALNENFAGRMYDARLPDGFAVFKVDQGKSFDVKTLKFNQVHSLNLDLTNQQLRSAGYAVDSSTGPGADLNIWKHHIFFDGSTYTVIAERYLEGQPGLSGAYEYKLFAGREGELEELFVKFNRYTGLPEVPGKSVALSFDFGLHGLPYFDEHAGLFMGHIMITKNPLSIYDLNSSEKKLIRTIPQLDRSSMYNISLMRLMGKHAFIPMMTSTPLDPLLSPNSFFSQSAPGRTLSLPHSGNEVSPSKANLSTGSGALVPASNPSNTTQVEKVGMSAWRIKQELKDLYPELGHYLDFPDQDRRRLAADFLLQGGTLDSEELKQRFLAGAGNREVLNVYLSFFSYLSWPAKEACFYMLEQTFSLYKDNRAQMVVLASHHLRDVIMQAPDLNHPKIRDLIFAVRSLREDFLDQYIDQALKRRRNQTKSIAGPQQKRIDLNGSKLRYLGIEEDCEHRILRLKDGGTQSRH